MSSLQGQDAQNDRWRTWTFDTNDGTVLSHTDYPEQPSGFPRMFGGLANSESVFVSFTSKWSGGD